MNEARIGALQSIEELQKLGTVEALRLEIESVVVPLKVVASSYEELWEIVRSIQINWAPCMKETFVSRKKELLYVLNNLDGKVRNAALGITREHYSDVDKAKTLLRSLRQQVADKTGTDPEADKAFKTLTEIFYNIMDVDDITSEEGNDTVQQ